MQMSGSAGSSGSPGRAAAAFLGLIVLAAWAPSGAQAADRAADFAISFGGPATARVGEQITYDVLLANQGPETESAKFRLTGGSGADDSGDGSSVETISATPSRGTCKTDVFGAFCRVGLVQPGAPVSVAVVIEVSAVDVPKMQMQATVEDDQTDNNIHDFERANDHFELITEVQQPIKLAGVPRRCASRPFSLTAKTRVVGGKKAKLVVDGKVVDATSGSKLRTKVDPAELDGAKHAVAVVIQSSVGPPLAELEQSFKTC